MTSAFITAATAEGHTELPLEPIWYGVIALGAFLALLALLWSFRNTLALDPTEYVEEKGRGRAARERTTGPGTGR